MTLFLLIAAVMFSLCVSAVCSLLEAALLSLTPGQVGELKRRRPAVGAIWERFKADVEQPISVILICNTAAHTIGATVAGGAVRAVHGREPRRRRGGRPSRFGGVFTVLMLPVHRDPAQDAGRAVQRLRPPASAGGRWRSWSGRCGRSCGRRSSSTAPSSASAATTPPPTSRRSPRWRRSPAAARRSPSSRNA